MASQTEKPRLKTQEELHKEVVEIRVRKSFERGIDTIKEASHYGVQAGLSEDEIDKLYGQALGEGE